MPLTKVPGSDIRDGTLTDVDVAAANIDGLPAVPSMRTLGTGAQQATAGTDSRLSDDRTADGLRSATTIVSISSAAAPTAGQVLVAINGTSADWQDQFVGLTDANLVDEETPIGTIDGVNAAFTIASAPVAGSLKVYLNGVRRRLGGADDYTFAGTTITFNAGVIPVTGDSLTVDYRVP